MMSPRPTTDLTILTLLCGLILVFSSGAAEEEKESDAARKMREKLEKIILPSVEFVDTPLADALEFLTLRSVELDPEREPEKPPEEKGIGIILEAKDFPEDSFPENGEGEGGGSGSGFDPEFTNGANTKSPGYRRVSLKLQNVTVAESMRRTLKIVGMKYTVEADGTVLVVPDESTR